MEIIVNGTLAVLKAGSSFQYVSENRAFTEAEGYSLSITFPIKGCQRNIQIFGHLYRPDVRAVNSTFDCEIRDKAFVKYGSLTLIDVSPEEIKAQFLEGQSAINNNIDFEQTYVNDLDLGKPISTQPTSPPYLAWSPSTWGDYVALPWCNNTDGTVHNGVTINENGDTEWDEGVTSISFFPYLIYLAEKICEQIGYTHDFFDWENDESKRWLIVCNTLPETFAAEFKNCIPHWTVNEFFTKLGYFLQGEFIFDDKAKLVTFKTFENLVPNEIIEIRDIFDSFEIQVTQESESEEIVDLRNIKYKEQDNPMWKYLYCPWFLENRKDNATKYATLTELMADNVKYKQVADYYRGSSIHDLFYAENVDMYTAIRCIRVEKEEGQENRYIRTCIMQPLNIFGDRVVDDKTDNALELEIVPAWIDEIVGKGQAIFQTITAEQDATTDSSVSIKDQLPKREDIIQPFCIQGLEQSDSESNEYFNSLPVAWWDGATIQGKIPCPGIDWITINEDWTTTIRPFSLRLNSYRSYYEGYNIQKESMLICSFLADSIPNVRSVFSINSQLYVCKKITATFTENGLSQLMKGEFYRIVPK